MTVIDDILRQPLADAIGWALLQFAWQGTVIGLLTAVLLSALRRSAADIRYVVSTIALSLMLTVPVVSVVQSLRAEPASVAVSSAFVAVASTPASTAEVEGRGRVVALSSLDDRALASAPGLDKWQPVLVGIWLAGVAILTLRLFSGWLWVQRMRSQGAQPVDAAVAERAQRLLRRLHISRDVKFLRSARVDVPTVIGWLKPVVLLPASALAGLTPQQLEAILAHELAHIRRQDYVVNLLQTVVETLLFYHPAVWWLSRQIRIERENCCDDLAVRLCGDPVTYASALAELEGLRPGANQLILAANGGSLLQRVRRVLGAPSHAGRAPGWLAAAAAIVVMVLISATAINHDRVTAEAARAIGTVQPWWEGAPAPARAGSSTERPIVDSRRARQLAREARDFARSTARDARDIAKDVRDAAQDVRDVAQDVRDVAQDVTDAALREATADLDRIPEAAASRIRAAVKPFEGLAPVVPPPSFAAKVSRFGTELAREAQQALVRAVNAVQSTSVSRSSTRGRNSGNFVWSNDGHRLEINYSGDIEFTDDDTDVKRMSPGASLKIREGGRFRADHTIELRADGSGHIERRYWEGRSEKPYDPDGRRWLATMLPRFIRQTGFNADKRVARIMKSGGVDGVLAEIALIEGSWAKSVYFKELLKQPNISNRAPQIFAAAGKEIDGDFELSELLAKNTSFINDEATRKAFLDAARTIGGDFEMKKVLSAVLSKGQPSAASVAALLDASATIGGDFELSSVLQEVARLRPLDLAARVPFFAALATVGGAHERQQVLSAVLKRDGQPAEVVAEVLAAAGQITGDFEASSVLVDVAKNHPIEGALRDPFFKAAASIQGAFERSKVLQAVVDRPDVSDETILAVIESAAKTSGHFERSQVLLRLARNHTLSRASRDAYIDAANGLGEFEQGQVLSALVRNERRR